MPSRRFLYLAVFVLFASSCRHAPPADPTAAVPTGTTAVAHLDIAAIQHSLLYAGLSPSARSLLNAAPGASHLLLAWNGHDLLLVTKGDFASPPAGFTAIAPHIGASGSEEIVRAARAQFATGRTGAPDLLAAAPTATPAPDLWIVAAGNSQLPLNGNLAMLGRLLHYTRYVTAAARSGESLTIDAAGICPSPADATELEEKLRALLSLFSMASHHTDLQSLANSVRLERDAATVLVHLTLSQEDLQKTLRLLAP